MSIDLDPIDCYYRIHGLGPAPGELADVVMENCLPRFLELFERRGLKCTLFVVGSEIDVEARGAAARAARATLAGAAADGHELGNHSYGHRYDLARLPAAEARPEIERAHRLIGELAGREVRGFRAPGYDLSPVMVDELMRLGYLYDSSIFPAPGYYAAKAAIMGLMRAAGRASGAVLTDPRALLAPAEPYRPSATAPWRRGQASIVELPIAVSPGVRVPAIGTTLLLAPHWARTRLLESMRRRSFFNLELHGVDLADTDEDGIPGDVAAREPAFRAPLADKLRALEATLDRLAADFDFVPLREAAIWAEREAV
ncbi:MAG TPA: polysaccharide deacetylase family protein [Kofleriaceae bacterium]|nr:polysaccharide deacetylase family protein [Kofleriaceae bacterium]